MAGEGWFCCGGSQQACTCDSAGLIIGLGRRVRKGLSAKGDGTMTVIWKASVVAGENCRGNARCGAKMGFFERTNLERELVARTD